MLEGLLQADRDLFLFLNNLGSETWDGFWLFLTNKWSSIPIYVILLLLSYRQFGIKRTVLILITVALLITTSDQLANFFKYGVQRLRPCYEQDLFESMRLVKSTCGGKFSFFSAHAANSFAVAGLFAGLFRNHFRGLAVLLLIWALLVSYSRIYIGVHYPLDIISGMLVGLLFSWLFGKLYIFAAHKLSI